MQVRCHLPVYKPRMAISWWTSRWASQTCPMRQKRRDAAHHRPPEESNTSHLTTAMQCRHLDAAIRRRKRKPR
ncbi:unnamed protein product [Ectocarpus fasciculatus]